VVNKLIITGVIKKVQEAVLVYDMKAYGGVEVWLLLHPHFVRFQVRRNMTAGKCTSLTQFGVNTSKHF
jgi:hypothetical protein